MAAVAVHTLEMRGFEDPDPAEAVVEMKAKGGGVLERLHGDERIKEEVAVLLEHVVLERRSDPIAPESVLHTDLVDIL